MPTMTAADRRGQAKQEYDVYVANCPSRMLLDRMSDKWVALILVALGDRTMRYSELSRAVAGVSQKMLTQTLRTLERDGLLTREVTVNVPVRVDYSLTPLGLSLRELMRGVKDWAESHMDEVFEAREDYDRRQHEER